MARTIILGQLSTSGHYQLAYNECEKFLLKGAYCISTCELQSKHCSLTLVGSCTGGSIKGITKYAKPENILFGEPLHINYQKTQKFVLNKCETLSNDKLKDHSHLSPNNSKILDSKIKKFLEDIAANNNKIPRNDIPFDEEIF